MNTVRGVEFSCTVSQFISDAFNSLSALRELEESGETTKNVVEDTANLIRKLGENTQRVKFSIPDGVTLLPQEDELSLQLAKQCHHLLTQISTRLKLFAHQDGLQNSSHSLEGDLTSGNDLWQPLDLIKSGLNERLAKHQWLAVSHMIHELGAKNSRLGINRNREIEELACSIDASFREINAKEVDDDKKLDTWLQVRTAAHRALDYVTEQSILSGLQFWTMDRRKDLISQEHENTFGWILEQEPSQDPSRPATTTFVDWLSRDEPLYWISGKPGSGKSTLMKHIAESQKTRDGLQRWAGDATLVTASFYFWSSAKDPLQKSDVGLLRSILFQILGQCPELIELAYPEHWKDRHSPVSSIQQFGQTELSITDLLAVYRRVSTLISTTNVKFCFFIDGLDEYDGEPTDMTRLVLSLSSTENIKACISSRQWAEFEDVFGGENPWKLYIHQLTKEDMRLYVEDLLNGDDTFVKIKGAGSDDEFQSLVGAIVENAQGVFLWVLLVTRSLLNSLADNDEISDLQRRLAAIPNDLDEYFNKIFFDIEPHMRVQTAQMFQVTLSATDKIPLLCYWFIQQGDGARHRSKDTNQRSLVPEVARERLEEMSKWLETHSQGLLKANNMIDGKIASSDLEEQHWLFEFRVDFLHRTVADFLRTAEMMKLLSEWCTSSFNVDFEISTACLATIDITPPKAAMFQDPPRASSIIHLLLSHAEQLDGITQTDLLDKFLSSLRRHDDVCNEIHAMILGPGNYWAYQSSFNFSILYHCVSYGLGDYVAVQLDRGVLQFSEPPSGLLSGCISWDPRVRTGKFNLSVNTIALLLKKGLDPNLPWGDRGISFWQQLLIAIYSRHLKGLATQSDFDAIACAMDHGVHLDAGVEIFAARRLGDTKAIDIVEKILPRGQFIALHPAVVE
ncbi:hypothetical protein BX600DRAFT_473389 [Xylariales sp. PMI_506]|nr:hypothetical protein BX600DRAFT_473389 [Xylariales sp. PMI_506]